MVAYSMTEFPMATDSSRRITQRNRGFTILESLIVLILLAVISLLILALIKHKVSPEIPAHLRAEQSGASALPPREE